MCGYVCVTVSESYEYIWSIRVRVGACFLFFFFFFWLYVEHMSVCVLLSTWFIHVRSAEGVYHGRNWIKLNSIRKPAEFRSTKNGEKRRNANNIQVHICNEHFVLRPDGDSPTQILSHSKWKFLSTKLPFESQIVPKIFHDICMPKPINHPSSFAPLNSYGSLLLAPTNSHSPLS